MKKMLALFLLGLFCVTSHAGVREERVAEIAAMLPATPQGLGAPISDRAFWDGLAPAFAHRVRWAEGHMDDPIPEQPDELFLDFSKTGNRSRFEAVAFRRRGTIQHFVYAECVENQGRFLANIEAYIEAYCAEKTWVLPAHDRKLQNFRGEIVEIDLFSSELAWELATIDYILGENLKPEIRALLRENLFARIVTPMRDMVEGRQKQAWWFRAPNNWNPVCLANVTGTALALVESPEDRACFIAAAESLIMNYLNGFTPDGYCSEGMSYWNYGFGKYLMLTETVYQSTGGQLDLLKIKAGHQLAQYGARAEIINDTYPRFADGGGKPSKALLGYISLRLGLGLREYEDISKPTSLGSTLYADMMCRSPVYSLLTMKPAATAAAPRGLRGWFPDAGVLILRPSGQTESGMGIALKGGNNGEQHNHNDIGSYMIVSGKAVPVTDPGGERYTARTFSARRYDSDVLNSYGHCVPVIGGKLQRNGKEAHAKVLMSSFSDEVDAVEFEMASAYNVPALTSLKRTFIYSREGGGGFRVRDEVSMSEPTTFENAIITKGTWKQLAPNTLEITDGEGCVVVTLVPTPDVELSITSSKLTADQGGNGKPTRIAIAFPDAVTNAALELRYVGR